MREWNTIVQFTGLVSLPKNLMSGFNIFPLVLDTSVLQVNCKLVHLICNCCIRAVIQESAHNFWSTSPDNYIHSKEKQYFLVHLERPEAVDEEPKSKKAKGEPASWKANNRKVCIHSITSAVFSQYAYINGVCMLSGMHMCNSALYMSSLTVHHPMWRLCSTAVGITIDRQFNEYI